MGALLELIGDVPHFDVVEVHFVESNFSYLQALLYFDLATVDSQHLILI
jgi:hypothetical protein